MLAQWAPDRLILCCLVGIACIAFAVLGVLSIHDPVKPPQEPGARFYASSYYCDRRGKIFAQASDTDDEVLVAELDLGMIEDVRTTWQFFLAAAPRPTRRWASCCHSGLRHRPGTRAPRLPAGPGGGRHARPPAYAAPAVSGWSAARVASPPR